MQLNDLLLNQIDIKKQKLDTLRPFSEKQVKNLKKFFDIDFTYNSTAIEGNTLTLQETRVVLLDGITIGGKTTREHLEIINHKEAIDYIEELSKKDIARVTKMDILNIHALVLKSIDSENAGKYRNVPVYVKLKSGGIHKYCDPLKIVDEMDSFFQWLNAGQYEHPVLFAAEAHTRLVTIHPFVDGNGRAARLLMNLILIHYGFPPAVIQVSKRVEYLDAVEIWQQENSKIPFQNMMLEAVINSLDTYITTIEENIVWE